MARNHRRNRGYFRVVREKKTGRRTHEARNADMPAGQSGRYSKSSPYTKDLSRRTWRFLKERRRSMFPSGRLMEAA